MDQPEPPQVVVRRSARRTKTATAYRDQESIVVLLPARMSGHDEQRYVSELVQKVLAREAKTAAPRGNAELAERARRLNERFLLPRLGRAPEPASVSWVGNQHQRWGSCTPATGAIRLSDRLRPMPGWVIDYVLLHELAHLSEPSHSPRFWSLVDGYPRAERARGFLEGFRAGPGAGSGPLSTGSEVDDLTSDLEGGDGVD